MSIEFKEKIPLNEPNKIVVSFIEHETGYLFQERKKDPYMGYMGLVGGAVEKGEWPDQAIIREIGEETGLYVDQPEFKGVVEEVFPDNTNYLFVYSAVGNGQINPSADEGNIVSLNEAPENLIPTDRIVLEKIAQGKFGYTKVQINRTPIGIETKEIVYPRSGVVIGNFKEYLPEVARVTGIFSSAGVEMLSPMGGKVINEGSEFVIFDYDPPNFSDRDIQLLVLAKMHAADFVYLVNPNGYLGKSAAFELGYAFAQGMQVFSMEEIKDMHKDFVTAVVSPGAAIQKIYG